MHHAIVHALMHLTAEGIKKVQENLNCHGCDHTNFGGWHAYTCCRQYMCGSCNSKTVRTGQCARCGSKVKVQ